MRDFCHVFNQGQSHRKQNYNELTHISFEISYMDWVKIWGYLITWNVYDFPYQWWLKF